MPLPPTDTPAGPDDLDLRRVVVAGSSCSGKTTFAKNLSRVLGAAHVELDAVYWGPNWTSPDDTAFREAVEEKLPVDGRWVVDGNYSKVRDITWGRATALVWLNYSFRTVFGRGLRRTLRRIATREELFSGNRESIRNTFLSRDSILLWIIQTYGRRRREFRALFEEGRFPHLAVVEFAKPDQADAFLGRLRSALRAPDRLGGAA